MCCTLSRYSAHFLASEKRTCFLKSRKLTELLFRNNKFGIEIIYIGSRLCYFLLVFEYNSIRLFFHKLYIIFESQYYSLSIRRFLCIRFNPIISITMEMCFYMRTQ